ncbi:hypothetical protein ABPG75_000067 [Micractinium tetrahymenae]
MGAPPSINSLTEQLARCGRGEGRAALLAHVRTGGDASDVAQALLGQPYAQLRAHGLLAARLAGRVDLVLAVLVAGDPGVWRAAGALLCQMELDADSMAKLLRWLHDASPAHRKDFLTRLGCTSPRPLGALLFSELLAAGRAQDALRLLRHGAGAMEDAELAALAREHLVEPQGARDRVPTWARQAWKHLAVARPTLCLELIQPLWRKVKEEVPAHHNDVCVQTLRVGYTAMHMLRRAVLALLHGAEGQRAAKALLVPREAYRRELQERETDCVVDGRLLVASKQPSTWPIGTPFKWHYVREDMSLLQHLGPSPDGGGEAGQAARALCMAALQLPTGKPNRGMRWAYRLQRRGLLAPVLHQATLQACEPGAPRPNLHWQWSGRSIMRAARLAASSGAADARELLGSIAAIALDKALFSGGDAILEEGSASRNKPWRACHQFSAHGLATFPNEALVRGAELLLEHHEARASSEGDSSTVAAKKAHVVERLRAFLAWEPSSRQELLTAVRTNRPLADERCALYKETLEQDLPPGCAAAVNDVVPLLLSRAKNERSFVHLQVLKRLCCLNWSGAPEEDWEAHAPPALALLAEEHLPQLEAALLSSLDVPDASDENTTVAAALVAEALRQGVLRPQGPLLAFGLRLQAILTRRFCSAAAAAAAAAATAAAAAAGDEDGPGAGRSSDSAVWHCPPEVVHTVAVMPGVLAASADLARAARELLAALLPLYQETGQQTAAYALLRYLAAGWTEHKLRPLWGLPELGAAVQPLLLQHLSEPRASSAGQGSRDTGRCSGSTNRWPPLQPPTDKQRAEQSCVRTCLAWWLTCEDELVALQRAQALLDPSGSSSGLRVFLQLELCKKWLLPEGKDPPSPAALWFQEQLCSNRQALQAVVENAPELCRKLLVRGERRGSCGGRLLQALLQEQLTSWRLCGIRPEYDTMALASPLEALASGNHESALAAVAGYVPAVAASGGFWEIKRRLGSTDFRRWAPAVQAQLQQLFSAAARAADASPSLRLGAVCLLIRLQDATCGDLEPLLEDPQLAGGSLLAAAKLPDKRGAARLLQGKLAGDNATFAAAGLRRTAAFLPDGELEELCGDLLSTAGLRTAAWQRVVAMLLERGSPKALELVWAEMARPDLTPSMRCGMISATGSLCGLPHVASFWEQCAALKDKEVGADLLRCIDLELLKSSAAVAEWWSKLAVSMLTSAAQDSSELATGWAVQLALSDVVVGFKNNPAELEYLVAALFQLAGSAAKGWEIGVWLLRRMLGPINFATAKPNGQRKLPAVRDSLSRHLQPLLEAAAAEQQQAAGMVGSGPATALLLQLLGRGCGHGERASVPTPWELGVAVPPALVALLWERYSAHLADRLTNVEGALAQGAPAKLADELAAAAAAAPGSAQAFTLAAALLKAGCPSCQDGSGTGQVFKNAAQCLQYARALLEVARSLAAPGTAAATSAAPGTAAAAPAQAGSAAEAVSSAAGAAAEPGATAPAAAGPALPRTLAAARELLAPALALAARKLLAAVVAAMGWLATYGEDGEELPAVQKALATEIVAQARPPSPAAPLFGLLLNNHMSGWSSWQADCPVAGLEAALRGHTARAARATCAACDAAHAEAGGTRRGRQQRRLAVHVSWAPRGGQAPA